MPIPTQAVANDDFIWSYPKITEWSSDCFIKTDMVGVMIETAMTFIASSIASSSITISCC